MKRRNIRAYLSGGMEHAPAEGSAWRNEMEAWLKNALGHEAFNPSTESRKLQRRWLSRGDFRTLRHTDNDRYMKYVRKIIQRDLRVVEDRSDYLVCLWDRRAHRGGGTVGEITTAYRNGIPVYLVTRIRRSNIPSWVLGCSTEIFSSFAQLKNFLVHQYR